MNWFPTYLRDIVISKDLVTNKIHVSFTNQNFSGVLFSRSNTFTVV